MLTLEGLGAGYGNLQVVRDLDMQVDGGEVLSLIGPNGAGKTTTISTLAGLLKPMAGRVLLDGTDITHLRLDQRVRHGIALVPEGRRVFADLSVTENLSVGGHHLARERLEPQRKRVLDLFPRLGERLGQMASLLSGGEQQMLALGRAIMAQPRLMLVDELSLGLMPKVVDECYAALNALAADGMAIVLVEQNTERALAVASRVVGLSSGDQVFNGSGDEARKNPAQFSAHLQPEQQGYA